MALWFILYVKRLKICHVYRENHLKELVETWHVREVTIARVPFCGLKGIRKKTTEVWHKTQLVSKLRDQFESTQLCHNLLEQWAESRSVVGEVIMESPCSSREESEYKIVSYEAKLNVCISSAMSRYSNRTVTLIEHSARLKVIQ